MDRTSSTGMDDAIPPALSAVLAEMRREAGTQTNPSPLYRYADRIESEVRRAGEEWEAVARAQDKAQTVMMEEIERLRAPGSAAALRRALEEVEGAIFEDEPGRFWLADAEEILRRVRAALATPARNCDVGTAEEQAERFRKACKSWSQADDQDYCSYECPIDGNGDCHEKFGQMPFSPEKGGSE